MYFAEWLAWLAYIDPKEERDAFESLNGSHGLHT